MKRASALICALILAGLSGLHFAWAAGWKQFGAGVIPTKPGRENPEEGTPLFDPPVLTTVGVGVALAAAALVVLRAGFTGRGRLLAMAVSFVFGARAVGDRKYVGYTKRVRGTEFARKDYWLYSPICIVVSFLAGRAAR